VRNLSFPDLARGIQDGPDWRTFTLVAVGKSAGASRSPWKNYQLLLADFRRRIDKGFPNVMAIDAVPGKDNARAGKGKSTLGIQIARDLVSYYDRKRNARVPFEKGAPLWSVREAAFSSRECLVLLRKLAPRRVVLYDESLLGLLAQGGRRNEELSDLIQVFSIVRAKKISMILCSQTIWMLDLFVREGLVDYWITVTDRGRANVEIPWRAQHFKRPNRLPYDPYRFSPIAFRKLPEKTGIWPEYDAWKMDHINLTIDDKLGHDRLSEKIAAKIATCPACGLRGSAWNIQTHRCPGPKKSDAAQAGPAPPSSPPPPATATG
jgi:hypothetical protein